MLQQPSIGEHIHILCWITFWFCLCIQLSLLGVRCYLKPLPMNVWTLWLLKILQITGIVRYSHNHGSLSVTNFWSVSGEAMHSETSNFLLKFLLLDVFLQSLRWRKKKTHSHLHPSNRHQEVFESICYVHNIMHIGKKSSSIWREVIPDYEATSIMLH